MVRCLCKAKVHLEVRDRLAKRKKREYIRCARLRRARLWRALMACPLAAVPAGPHFLNCTPPRERAIPHDLLAMVHASLGDRYRVERELGRGGAARIFSARDNTGRLVALKILHPELLPSLTAKRFLREIGFLKELHHPHIAPLLDFGEADWLLYFVMPCFEGPTLRQQLTEVRRLPLREACTVADEILDALDYAHSKGIVHRDVKPENVVLSPESGTILVDFGIARAIAASESDRVTRSGFTVGTSVYMSPEQAAGASQLDHRSDLYSLGCVLFECLTGQPPFAHRMDAMVLEMHQRAAPPDARDLLPSLSRSLAKVLATALQKNPGDRWQSAAAMRQALTASAGG